MLSVTYKPFMLSVIMFNVIMLSVMAPLSLDGDPTQIHSYIDNLANRMKPGPRKSYCKGKLSTFDLLFKIACFVKNIFMH
jgi:hypothetical protein